MSSSDHVYIRPVLVYAQEIINFAQWQLDDNCRNYFDVRVHEHWPVRAELKYVRVHEHTQFGNKLIIFTENFSQQYCYLHIPTCVS